MPGSGQFSARQWGLNGLLDWDLCEAGFDRCERLERRAESEEQLKFPRPLRELEIDKQLE